MRLTADEINVAGLHFTRHDLNALALIDGVALSRRASISVIRGSAWHVKTNARKTRSAVMQPVDIRRSTVDRFASFQARARESLG